MNESINQQRYIRKYRQQQKLTRIIRWLVFIIFISLWELFSDFSWIDSFIFSSPSQIFLTFFSMLKDHQLLTHISATLSETFASFFLVTFISTFLSLVLWFFPYAASVAEPYLVILNSLPKSALAPLFIVWLGASQKTIITAGISVALFGSVISQHAGFQEIDPDDIKLIYTLGGRKKDVLKKVVLPSSIPYLMSIMKVNIGLCLVGVVIGEFIGARKGLGYLIIYSSQVFKMNWMLLSIVLLCMISMGLYSVLNFMEKKFTQHQ